MTGNSQELHNVQIPKRIERIWDVAPVNIFPFSFFFPFFGTSSVISLSQFPKKDMKEEEKENIPIDSFPNPREQERYLFVYFLFVTGSLGYSCRCLGNNVHAFPILTTAKEKEKKDYFPFPFLWELSYEIGRGNRL